MSSTGSALSLDTYTYDGNLRLSGMAASWQSGSGNSGTYFSQALSYDPASNLTSLQTTQASVPGVSNSGGSETQVFCYDEQNRLTWAGNSGTPSCSGNGTPSVSGGIPAYSSSYAYTNLGQLAQGPLAGGSEYQYLYCTSSQPHQLTGLYPIGTTATLSYNLLDHLTKWFVSSTNKEQYAYDASGERVLRRVTYSMVTRLKVADGTKAIYNLEVARDHTFAGSPLSPFGVHLRASGYQAPAKYIL